MPRFAFAVPFLPQQQRTWRATADELATRHASEHRRFLLDRGIFKERVWMQVGVGTPPLTLVLIDCDDVERVFSGSAHRGTDHEAWLGNQIIAGIHGVTAPRDVTPPTTELLSGTTTMATANAGTQTMFALPLPTEAISPVRELIGRIEHGDLAQAHGQFLVDASIREEWMWLQQPHPGSPALLLVHWIGDDLTAAWQRLTFVRDDLYARVLHQALFTRLAGLSPDQVSHWEIEQLIVMHVRRSDGRSGAQLRPARRLFGAMAKGTAGSAAEVLTDDVELVDARGVAASGRDDVVVALDKMMAAESGRASGVEVMAGGTHVFGLLGADTPQPIPILGTLRGSQVCRLAILQPPPP